jgi:DNA-binding IclR family transcriptional regulator
MAKKDNPDRYRAPALDKGLDILELLAQQANGMSRSEIVAAMEKSPSEIYRMIERLVARGYINRNITGDRFVLSMKLYLLGATHPPLRRLTSHAQPLMDQFAETSLQSIHFAIPEAGKALVIAQASSPASWEFRLREGAELDLKSTSSGKTLLAFQDQLGLEKLLFKSENIATDNKISTELRTELDVIKSLGYRISNSGQLVGITDISVATLGTDGNAFGVLTCPYIERVDVKDPKKLKMSIEETKSLMLELAENISFKQLSLPREP